MFEELKQLDELRNNTPEERIRKKVMCNHIEQLALDILSIKLKESLLGYPLYAVAFPVEFSTIYSLQTDVNNAIFHRYKVYQDIHPKRKHAENRYFLRKKTSLKHSARFTYRCFFFLFFLNDILNIIDIEKREKILFH